MKKSETDIDVGACAKHALGDRSNVWLAKQMGVSPQRVSIILKSKSANTETVSALSWVFKIPASIFVRLNKKVNK